MSKIDQVVKTLGETLGVDPGSIRVQASEWTQYMTAGVCVEIHVRRWRGVTRLSLEDLGLDHEESEKIVDDLIRLGDKYLLPPRIVRELNAIDTGARKALEKYGYRLLWGRFLPAASYMAWKEENEKFVSRYYAIRDRIVDDYEEFRSQMIESYAAAARTAFRRQAKLSGLSAAAEDIFTERFVDRVIGLIPSKEAIRDSFKFEIELSYIPLPSLLAEDRAAADRIRAERDAERELTTAEIEMRKDVLRTAKDQKENLLNNFMKDVVSQLNSALYEAVSDVLATTGKNGVVHPRSVVQLESLISKIRAMNFFGYDEIEKMLSEAESIVRTSPADRNVENVSEKLRDIATVTRGTLIGLGERPRSARRVGVPDNVSPEISRRARGRLGIIEIDVPEVGERRNVRKTVEA